MFLSILPILLWIFASLFIIVSNRDSNACAVSASDLWLVPLLSAWDCSFGGLSKLEGKSTEALDPEVGY